MPRPLQRARLRRGLRAIAVLIAGVLGFAVSAMVGVAIAKSLTLHVATATVTDTGTGVSKTEPIVVSSRGFALYTLSGDSKKHPKCTKANGCFEFWPPLKVSSAKKLSKQAGIKGKLSVWKRDGFKQVLLAGHPLYMFSGDSHKGVATGQGIKTFHGTWSVIASSSGGGGDNSGTGTGGIPTMPTGTSTPTNTGTTPYMPPY